VGRFLRQSVEQFLQQLRLQRISMLHSGTNSVKWTIGVGLAYIVPKKNRRHF